MQRLLDGRPNRGLVLRMDAVPHLIGVQRFLPIQTEQVKGFARGREAAGARVGFSKPHFAGFHG